MPDNRVIAALRVARKLNMAERALDQAVSAAGELVTELPMARLASGIAAEVGHNELGAVISALAGLHAVRGSLVETHKGLNGLREMFGLPEMAQGDKGDPPVGLVITPPAANAA